MIVSGVTVESKATNSSNYPFATFHSQCSFVNFIDLLVSNPYFQGKAIVDLEVERSKDK